MSLDEHFLIHLDMIDDKNVEQSLKNIDYRLKEISEDLLNVGHGSKEVAVFTNEMKTLSSVTKSVASAVAILNKTNAQAAKDAESVALAHQKVATEAGKTARELEKAKTQAANTAVANQKLSTEMEKTATAHARAEMAALRVAQAHEKQALKAQQAVSPYNRLNQELKEQAQKIKDVIAGTIRGENAYKRNDYTLQRMVNRYKDLRNNLDTTNAKFNALTDSIKQTQTAGMAFASFLGNFLANILQRFISSLGQMTQELSKAGVALDGITNTFAAGARGWKQGNEEMSWVAETAEKLGLNLQSTYEPYAKFMTSFTRSGGTLQESRQIFEDLSTAMVSLHLSSDQMNNVFVALEQMANKGTVQAEELKRQLGNALPGAFELAAQSMNLTTAELMDMMKKGNVVSREFLPKFAALVKDSLGTQIGIAVNQYNAHLNRLKSQTFLLQASLGQILNEALTPFVQGLTGITKGINLLIKSFGDTTFMATTLQVAFVSLGVVLGSYIVKLSAATVASVNLALAEGKITPALAMFQKSLIGINKVLTTNITLSGFATAATNTLKAAWTAIIAHPIGAVLMATGAAFLYVSNCINKANKEIAEQYVQIRDVTSNVTGLISEYSQLSVISNKTTAQQEAYNRVLGELQNSYPELLEYIKENKIDLTNLTQEQANNIASLAILQKTQDAEKVKLRELSDGWVIFGTRLKQAGMYVLLFCQTAEANFAHLGIAVTQIFARIGGGILKTWEWLYNKGNKIASFLGFEDIATKFKRVENLAKEHANNLFDFGKQAHLNLDNALRMYARQIVNVETTRIEKAEKNFKDTLATLGQEQSKIAQQLMYSSNNLMNVATGEQGKKKEKGKTSKDKEKDTNNKRRALQERQAAENEWQILQKRQAAITEQIKNNILLHKSTTDLEEEYKKNQTEIDRVTKAIQELNKAEKELNMTEAEEAIKAWEDKKKALQNAEKQYKGMILAGNNCTQSQLDQQKAIMKTLKAENAYYERLENREDLMKISTRSAQQLSNELIDGIFEPLKEGEKLWDRFKDAGISALKSIAAAWAKSFMQDIVTGFQSGFITGQGGFLSKIINGFMGIQTLLQGKALNGGLGTANVSSSTNALSSTTQQAQGLAQTLQSQTVPAVASTVNAISGVQNPALLAAQSVANMAISAPIAATGMGALSATMTVANTAFTSAAPALVKMAGAMASLAASAGSAATSMAALAVATAAQSVAQIPLVGGFLAPVAALATGAAVAAGTALTGAAIGASAAMAGAGQMLGGAMAGVGNKLSGVSGLQKGTSVVPHAKGGIVSSPTMFPMQGGNIGLAGEAGTEVIAPARRMSNGDVGIGAVQPQVIVNNYTNAAVEVKKRPDNSMEIKIAELNTMLSSSRTNKGMSNAQSRLQKNGRQIG